MTVAVVIRKAFREIIEIDRDMVRRVEEMFPKKTSLTKAHQERIGVEMDRLHMITKIMLRGIDQEEDLKDKNLEDLTIIWESRMLMFHGQEWQC